MTKSQHTILEALRRLTLDGWPTTVRELQAEAGIASTHTVQTHLYALKRLGLAQRHPRNARGGWLPLDLGSDRPT